MLSMLPAYAGTKGNHQGNSLSPSYIRPPGYCIAKASQMSEYKFTTQPPDALKCLICISDVAQDPWQHDKCGKLFCNLCLERYGKHQACPNCREEIPGYFEDTRGTASTVLVHVVS
jgi:hypothetical protein